MFKLHEYVYTHVFVSTECKINHGGGALEKSWTGNMKGEMREKGIN